MSINLSYLILFGHKVNVAVWLTVSEGYYFIQNSKEMKMRKVEGWQAEMFERRTLCYPVGFLKSAPTMNSPPGHSKEASIACGCPESSSLEFFILVKAFRSLKTISGNFNSVLVWEMSTLLQ